MGRFAAPIIARSWQPNHLHAGCQYGGGYVLRRTSLCILLDKEFVMENHESAGDIDDDAVLLGGRGRGEGSFQGGEVNGYHTGRMDTKSRNVNRLHAVAGI